jgi:asparagine synthetase B (glutamine-hydrolysing)
MPFIRRSLCSQPDVNAQHFSLQVDLERLTVHADRPLAKVDGCLVAWVGHLAGDPPDTAMRLVQGYLQHGRNLTAHLLGQYAGILIDVSRRLVLLFQDSLGLRTIYYAVDGMRLTAGAELGALARLRGCREIEPGYFAALIAQGLPPHHLSPLQGVARLSIGSTIEFRGHSRETVQPWSPPASPAPPCADAPEQLRHLLDEAVAACLPQSGPVGCELSGGLDSTSVYAMLLRRRPDAHAITLISRAGLAGDDEGFARHAVESLGGSWQLLDIDDCPPALCGELRLSGEPGDDRLATRQTAYRKLLERHGIEVVLTGGGGDLLFGYRGIASPHLADFVYKGRLFAAIRHARLWCARQGGVRPWTHTMAHYGLHLARRHFLRQSLFGRDWKPPAWFSARFAKRYGLYQAPPRQPVPRLGSPSQQYLWEGVYRIATLQASSGFRQHLPAQTRFPLFHRPLVEFMFGLDWSLRDSGVRGDLPGDRVLQRTALAGILPARIASRQTKASDQQARERGESAQPALFDLLTTDSRLVRHGWVEPVAWQETVQRARFGVYDKLSAFDAAVASELWLRNAERDPLAPPPVLYPVTASGAV